MEFFSPFLLLLFIWIFIGIPVSVAKKAANQKKASGAGTPAKTARTADLPAAAPKPAVQERLVSLTPSLYEPDHDDSVFTGSLGPVMSEGYDPCHDDQLGDLEPVCRPGRETPAPKAAPGLPLGFTGNDMVRGIVMSEILNRKH